MILGPYTSIDCSHSHVVVFPFPSLFKSNYHSRGNPMHSIPMGTSISMHTSRPNHETTKLSDNWADTVLVSSARQGWQENINYTVCPEKKWASQTFWTDKCKHAPYWTKSSMHSPRSIWVIVAKFHTIPSYHLTDFQFLQIVVTDFSYRHDLLTTHDGRHLHHAFVRCPKTSSHFKKITLRPTMLERQLHCFQLRHPTSSVHSTGHRTARTSIRLTTRSGAFCKSESTVAGSVTSTIWKNDWLQNGADLTGTSLTLLSTSGGSDFVDVSERTEDTLSIKFKRSDYLTWQQLCLLIEFLTGFI